MTSEVMVYELPVNAREMLDSASIICFSSTDDSEHVTHLANHLNCCYITFSPFCGDL